MSFLSINDKMPVVQHIDRASLPPPVYRLSVPDNIGSCEKNSGRPICLTFDDGPDPIFTPKILDVLADYEAKATFFVVGEAAGQFPHLIEQMLMAGHSIGNHTHSHRHPWLMSSERAKQEVSQANATIKNITGITPRWFRPPFGRLRTAMCVQAHLEQMTTVLWSRSIIDWGVLGTQAGIAKRLAQIETGDVVLMHDGRPQHNHPEITVQCLPRFLQSLSDKSLRACNLDSIT